jgi:hypothetical protein
MNISAAHQAAPKGQGHTQARHRAPEVGLHAPQPGAWLQFFLAFLLQLAGLLPPPNTPEGREAAQALRELQDLIARYARGELTPHTRHHAAELRPRLPRAQRRIRLTPGLYAALFFTPRAATAARARIAARTGQLTTALQALSRFPVSIFGPSPHLPTHAHFVLLS